MKVKELIPILEQYNPEAEVKVNAHSRHWDFTMASGGAEGATKANCETVSFYVDELSNQELSAFDFCDCRIPLGVYDFVKGHICMTCGKPVLKTS